MNELTNSSNCNDNFDIILQMSNIFPYTGESSHIL